MIEIFQACVIFFVLVVIFVAAINATRDKGDPDGRYR